MAVRVSSRRRRSDVGRWWPDVFLACHRIERALADRTPRRRPFELHDTTARRPGLEPEHVQRPLVGMLRDFPDEPTRVSARVGADLVRIGKFDTASLVRGRMFSEVDGPQPRTVRFQASDPTGGSGIERELPARESVARHAPELAPRLIVSGHLRRPGLSYLGESLVYGRHPRNPAEVGALLPEILEGFAHLHEGVGTESRHLSRVVAADLPARVHGLVEAGWLDGPTAAALVRVIERDALLQIGLGHGDLVRTNMLMREDRVVLIDWEYAREMPVLFDLAKPIYLAEDRVEALRLVRSVFGDLLDGSGCYAIEEQVALGIAQLLSWTPERHRKAVAAGRERYFLADVEGRTALLRQLLGTA